MLISIFSLFTMPLNSVSEPPKTISLTAVEIETPSLAIGSSFHKKTKEDNKTPEQIIAEYCRHDSQWQQQLCYETHLAMLNNGSLKLQPEDGSFIPITEQESPDDMPLKEWARLFPVQ